MFSRNRTILSRMGVRKLVRELHGSGEEQAQHVQKCVAAAGALTPGAKHAAAAAAGEGTGKLDISGSVCFAEVADSNGEASTIGTSSPAHAALSGVTVAVADCLDVSGFSSRFGLTSSIYHHVARPENEFPFVSWMKMHGAHVVGKLACHTPLCLEEATVISASNSAAIAVTSGACDFALTSSIVGPAGLTSCLFHDVCSFKPTARSFAGPRGLASPFWADSQSVALVGRHFDDLLYLWHVHTGEFNASMIKQNKAPSSSSSVPPPASSASTAAASSPPSSSIAAAEDFQKASLWRWLRNRAATKRNKKKTSRLDTTDAKIDLTVGFPAKWIDEFMGQRITSNAFAYQLHQLREKHRPLFKGNQDSTNLRIRPIEFNSIDLDLVFKNANVIAAYELANAFDANIDKYVLGHSSSSSSSSSSSLSSSSSWSLEGVLSSPGAAGMSAGSALPASSRAASAFLDELPQPVVTTIFEGRRLTSWDYSRALQGRERIVSYVEELFRDVDVICSPIVSEPFADGNTRSILMTLPFSMVGSPTASAYLSDELSVQLVGELGRDSGLLDDATAFLSFVKGASPGWFRRKFLNEK